MLNQTRISCPTRFFLLALFCCFSYSSATELLLHFDGAGSNFTDSSGNNHQVNVVGNVVQSSTESIQGGSSAFFDGSSHLEITHPSDFLFASGADYTIDFWVNSTNLSRSHALSFGNDFSDNIDFDFNDGGFGFWVYHRSTGANLIRHSPAGTFTDGEWHHVATVRENGIITNYMDGVARGTLAMNVELGSNKVSIGKAVHTGAINWQGFVDEVRVVNGEALFTQDFNPLEQFEDNIVPEISSFYLCLLGLFFFRRTTSPL